MAYTTQRAATNAFHALMPSFAGIVYQFPQGHWHYATIKSPVGQSVIADGLIYPAQGCYPAVPAQRWAYVSAANDND